MKDEKLRMEIAKRLKEIRLKKGLTQSDVAKLAGLNSNFYAKVERGEAKPSVETIKKISEGLKVKSSDILPF